MFDNRDYAPASLNDRIEMQTTIGMIFFVFLALAALIVQLIGGLMTGWLFVGIASVVMFCTLAVSLRLGNGRQDRF